MLSMAMEHTLHQGSPSCKPWLILIFKSICCLTQIQICLLCAISPFPCPHTPLTAPCTHLQPHPPLHTYHAPCLLNKNFCTPEVLILHCTLKREDQLQVEVIATLIQGGIALVPAISVVSMVLHNSYLVLHN